MRLAKKRGVVTAKVKVPKSENAKGSEPGTESLNTNVNKHVKESDSENESVEGLKAKDSPEKRSKGLKAKDQKE